MLAGSTLRVSALPPQLPTVTSGGQDVVEEELPATGEQNQLLAGNIAPAPVVAMPNATQQDAIVIEDKDFQFSQKTVNPKKTPREKDVANGTPDIYLNFENSSLANVVNYMAELKNINLLPDKSLADVKVSLTIREAQTVEGAWKIFLTLLEVSGYSIVEVDGLHKVLPKDKKLTEALPSYINVPYTTLPDSDLTVRYVMFLQNLEVDSIKDLLESLLSDKHTLFPYAQAKCFIITDRCYNIKSAMKVIRELDTMGQAETVVVMRLKQTNATDVKDLLEGLMKKADTNPLARLFAKSTDTTNDYFPAGTKIIAEDRTNSLILMGTPEPIKKIEKFIVEHIDVELKASESPLHIYDLQYTDATQIAEILKEVTAPPEQGPGQQAAKYGAIRGGVKYFKSMKFLADKEANRLVISCTDKQDWQMVKGIIKDLDKPQPQVAMETLFVEVTANDLDQMGGSLRNPKANTLGGSINFQSANLTGPTLSTPEDASTDPVTLLGDMFKQLVSDQGSTLLSFGKKANIWAVFEMIRTRTNATILSQPFLTIANKVTGKIAVGEERNVLMDDAGNGGLKGYGSVTADTSLEIEPQINLDGVIRLKINVNISEFTNPAAGEKSNKQVNTNVTMADGQVLILGGFVKTKVGENTSKTPLLSNIPILGWFFKNQARTIDRSYIFIFMAPTIVKPRTAPGVELYTKMKLHAATNDIEDGIKTIKSNDPLFNWFFDPKQENYSHKVVDFANARYQPTSVDIKHDPYYRSTPEEDENETNKIISRQPIHKEQPVIFTDEAATPTMPTLPTSVLTPVVQQPHVQTPPTPLIALADQETSAAPEPPVASQSIMQQLAPPAEEKKAAPKATPNVIKSLVDTRLGLDAPLEQMHTPIKDLISPQQDETTMEPKPSIPRPEAHAAQQDVLALLNDRMQQQRLINVDDSHLDSQRKKLKSMISQTYNGYGKKNGSPAQVKQSALKALLEVPAPTTTSQPELVVDPAKRNSLKNFLLRADQTTGTARNNPS